MITGFTATFVLTTIVVLSYMLVAFAVAIMKKHYGVADIAWGVGFIVAAIASLALNPPVTDRKLLVTFFVFLWGVRLSSYLWVRMSGEAEDWRYKERREQWGDVASVRIFFQVFVVQGILLLLIAMPVLYVNTYGGGPFAWTDVVGVVLWCVGFSYEVVSDSQLFRFKRDQRHKKQIFANGLWRYSRHPNYFGECLMWWGIFLIALSIPGGFLTGFGPLLITFLLLRVSGVPLLERHMSTRPNFDRYCRQTSMIIPWFPRRINASAT